MQIIIMCFYYYYYYYYFNSGSNAITICKEHQLLAVGTETGRIECFDPRSRSRVGLLTATDDK